MIAEQIHLRGLWLDLTGVVTPNMPQTDPAPPVIEPPPKPQGDPPPVPVTPPLEPPPASEPPPMQA